jgi:hypothetical protein
MTHAEAQELLLDLAYGELPNDRALEAERHLETCADCSRERAQLAATRRSVAPLTEQEEPPPGFDDRILAAARAEASLRADGTPGAVIEVTGSVRPSGLEPAMVDPRAPVRAAGRAARPRRALRWATFGSVAAAAALVLAVTSTRGKRPEPAVESSAYEIHIKAPQQQPEPAVVGGAAVQPAPTPPPAAPAETANSAPAEVADKAVRAETEASREDAAERVAGGGGDVSDAVAGTRGAGASTGKGLAALGSRQGTGALAPEAAPAAPPPVIIEAEREKKAAPNLPRAAAKPAKATPPEQGPREDTGGAAGRKPEVAPALSGAAQSVAASPEETGASRAMAAPAEEGRAVAAGADRGPDPGRIIASTTATRAANAPAPAAAPRAVASASAPEKAAAPSPEALEDAARKSRREANYALAAAQYRKAAQLRQGGADLSTAAWDLAHAIECLSAISQWDEARRVRRELQQLYPTEQSAASAAARALRPAELAPSGDAIIDPGK